MSIWINILNEKKKKEAPRKEKEGLPLYAPIYDEYDHINPYDNNKIRNKKSIKKKYKEYPETISDFEVDLDIGDDFNVTKAGTIIYKYK